MKKNRMMRLASVLLVLTLLTTSMISGTFAKYTTSVNSEDTARVAKWGFGATTMDITGLFAKAYDAGAADATVTSKDSADVIAPGTAGSAKFAFAYDSTSNSIAAPEVAYDFTVSVDGSVCDPTIAGNSNIQWKLDGGDWGDWGTLLNSIKALSGEEDGTAHYGPGALPAAFNNNQEHTVSWQWIFETANDTAQDVKDTALGNAGVLANVTLKITVNATQVD